MDDDKDAIVAAILDGLRKTDALERKHAGFWNSHKKSAKELGLFSEVFTRLQQDYGKKISSWDRCEHDPPDIEFTIDEQRFGVEITELVNEKAIRAQIKRSPKYSEEMLGFSPDAAKQRLNELIVEKELKVKGVAPKYDEMLLLVHTDEPMLSSRDFLGYQVPRSSEYFDRIYLLFSYEPEKSESPMLRVL